MRATDTLADLWPELLRVRRLPMSGEVPMPVADGNEYPFTADVRCGEGLEGSSGLGIFFIFCFSVAGCGGGGTNSARGRP